MGKNDVIPSASLAKLLTNTVTKTNAVYTTAHYGNDIKSYMEIRVKKKFWQNAHWERIGSFIN